MKQKLLVTLLCLSVNACGGNNAGIPPGDLGLPMNTSDILVDNGMFGPFGVYRSSGDEVGLGHSGIDFPLAESAPIYAVADGVIAQAKDASPKNGLNVGLFIGATSLENKKNWIFLYGGIELLSGIGVGSSVQKGQQIGTAAMPLGHTTHLELAYVYDARMFTSDQTCWVDQLASDANSALLAHFNDVVRVSAHFISSWDSTPAFKALLDLGKYPDGARMCYPKGTDVRP